MEVLKALAAIIVLAAPCSYTAIGLKTNNKKMLWHLFSLMLTTILFVGLAMSGSGRMHYQQIFIIGLPTILVMLFSTSLVRSQEINNGE